MGYWHSLCHTFKQGLLLGFLLLFSRSAMAAGIVDSLADIVSWIAIIIIPVVLAIIYWQIHYSQDPEAQLNLAELLDQAFLK